MILVDAVPVPVPYQALNPIILVADSDDRHSKKSDYFATVGRCYAVYQNLYQKSYDGSTENSIGGEEYLAPGESAREAFYIKDKMPLYAKFNSLVSEGPVDISSAEELYKPKYISLIEQPKHGVLTQSENGEAIYKYKANAKFQGTDRVTFVIELAGYRIKVINYIKVVGEKIEFRPDTEQWDKIFAKYCPLGKEVWEIPPSATSHSLTTEQLNTGLKDSLR